jgi:hypothetical protein
MKHKGSCHCGAIEIELETDRLLKDQVVGACSRASSAAPIGTDTEWQ